MNRNFNNQQNFARNRGVIQNSNYRQNYYQQNEQNNFNQQSKDLSLDNRNRNINQQGFYKQKSKLCRYYQQNGFCQIGTNCSFAHGERELVQINNRQNTFSVERSQDRVINNNQSKTRLCFHYQQGGSNECPRRDNCSFAHGQHELVKINQTNTYNITELDQRKKFFMKTQYCKYFDEGKCFKSEICNYAHSQKEMAHFEEILKQPNIVSKDIYKPLNFQQNNEHSIYNNELLNQFKDYNELIFTTNDNQLDRINSVSLYQLQIIMIGLQQMQIKNEVYKQKLQAAENQWQMSQVSNCSQVLNEIIYDMELDQKIKKQILQILQDAQMLAQKYWDKIQQHI